MIGCAFTILLRGVSSLLFALETYFGQECTKLGNLSLGTLSVGENYIPEASLPQIRKITDGAIRQARNINDPGNIATIAPTLYINTQIRGLSVIVVGIDPESELAIKTWWEISNGTYLAGSNQAVVGALTAELLKLKVGD